MAPRTSTAMQHEGGPFEYRFAPWTLGSISVARRVLNAWLRAQPGLDDDAAHDLLVAVSELCANAAEHASGRTGSVVLRAARDGDGVVVEVEDDGPGAGTTFTIDVREPDPLAERGRGLYLVSRLVDDFAFERTPSSTTARCTKSHVFWPVRV